MTAQITIVNKENKVIGSSPRLDTYKNGLWHRIVVILVFNQKGQMYIQQRSPNADTAPNLWDHSAAGHVDANEKPQQAASRELSEELGIKANNLTFLTIIETQRTEGERQFNRFWYIYTYVYDGKMTLQEEEVKRGKFVEVSWLQQDMNDNPTKYADGLKHSLHAYLSSK